MTTKTNSKTVAATTTKAAPGSLMDMLASAVATQATGFKQVEIARRTQAKEVVGADADLLTLQTMVSEAEDLGLSPEFMTEFKEKAKIGRQLLIEAEAAGQMARRLAAASTVEGLQAQIEKAKAANAAKAEEEKKAKAAEAQRKAQEAKEERIAQIVSDLGDITPKTAHAVTCFLRGNKWDYRANEAGRKALLAAAGRAAKAFNEARAARAKSEAEAAKAKAEAAAAAAPLTHKVIK